MKSYDLIRYRMEKKREAQEECVTTLSNIINACKWGSGFTDAEILAQIRKDTPQTLKLLDRAKGLV